MAITFSVAGKRLASRRRSAYNQIMRRFSLIVLVVFSVVRGLAAPGELLCGTWNLRWFPSGRANVRSSPEAEAARIRAVGGLVSSSLDSIDEKGGAPVLLFFQEIRDGISCTNLLEAIGKGGLKVAAISGYRDRNGLLSWQQDAILTTLPVRESLSVVWHSSRSDPVPRGYAYALLDGGAKGPIAAFCVHLKSNLNRAGSLEQEQRNIYARERAASEILAKLRSLRHLAAGLRVVVGGDFNTDSEEDPFVSESTLRSFYGAHFRSCFADVAPEDRVTHPASGPYPDATFDYILYRGFDRITGRYIFPGKPFSDHNPVFVELPL